MKENTIIPEIPNSMPFPWRVVNDDIMSNFLAVSFSWAKIKLDRTFFYSFIL